MDQSFDKWEAIIVDDGSGDNTLELVSRFVCSDDRIKLFERSREPKGASTCRNIGIEQARGTYVIFLDSDDKLTSDCIKRRYEYAANLKFDFDFVVFTVGAMNSEGKVMDFTYRPSGQGNHVYDFLAYRVPWNISSPLWQKASLVNLNGFDESFERLQDVELHTRALLHPGVKYYILNTEPDMFYRLGGFNASKLYSALNSFSLYIDKFTLIISAITDGIARDRMMLSIKRAFIVFFFHFTLFKANNTIVGKDLLILANKRNVVKKDQYLLYKIVLLLFRLGFNKVRGFKWLINKLLVIPQLG